MSWDAWVLMILIAGCAAIVLICIGEDVRERRRFMKGENRAARIQIRDGECITAPVRRKPSGRHRDELARP
ncbi:hypothetical protein GFY24_29365 [Nocardia sp. SYP-A9097]|uniref:hypothetical protein n=1 Tax=Nocardia sp. SYP-A9097 TaxID=2663237 RepID=UPI00129AE611|nr:hypothetical protein [Nocardia sp. SYP-A9097]MRH91502.1 hypothetical protein [Nocardia sp. SYP-A9097]